MFEDMSVAVVYTDGACIGNPGPGGYAAVVQFMEDKAVVLGGEPHTTNNRMELMAAIKALESLPEGIAVVLHSDSQYLVKGASEWLPGWKVKGWRTSNEKAVENQDLWQRMDELGSRRSVTWSWSGVTLVSLRTSRRIGWLTLRPRSRGRWSK